MAELTPKQKLFAEEYCKDRNGKQAAIRAGYAERSAEMQASRLLRNDKVSDYVQQSIKVASEANQVTAESVIKELSRGAFAELDINDMKWSDKMKCLELLCKNLGLLDGIGAKKGDTGSNKNTILDAIKRIGIGTPGNSKPSDSY